MIPETTTATMHSHTKGRMFSRAVGGMALAKPRIGARTTPTGIEKSVPITMTP